MMTDLPHPQALTLLPVSLAHLPSRTPLDRPTPPDYGMDIKPGGQSSASPAFLV